MEDHRIFARIEASLPLMFLDPDSGREGQAQTVDISANGVGFVTNDTLSEKTPLEMWLRIPDQHDPLYTRGAVVWTQNISGTLERRIGVHLDRAELMGLARVLWLKKS